MWKCGNLCNYKKRFIQLKIKLNEKHIFIAIFYKIYDFQTE